MNSLHESIRRPLPTHAMLLAAGRGLRMRPLTDTTPKPLVRIRGRPLLDRALDALEKVHVKKVVVNVHHLAQQICDHIEQERSKRTFDICISDETAELLDSAGAVVKALPGLGTQAFFILNSDTFWYDSHESNLLRLAQRFDPEEMDMLLLTVSRHQAGAHGSGDFLPARDGRLVRAGSDNAAAVIYAGALLVSPALFEGAAPHPHSLNLYFDRSIAAGRLFGLPLAGRWYTVGSIAMIAAVERRLQQEGE